jgi:hypothetical protein
MIEPILQNKKGIRWMLQNDFRRTKHHSPDSQLDQLSFSVIYPNVATLRVISHLTFIADSTIFGVIE